MSKIKVGDRVRKNRHYVGAEGVVTEITSLGSLRYRCIKASACGLMNVGGSGSDYPENFTLIEKSLAEQIAEAEAKLAELKKTEAEARVAAVVPGAKFRAVHNSKTVFTIVAVNNAKCWYHTSGDIHGIVDRISFASPTYELVTD